MELEELTASVNYVLSLTKMIKEDLKVDSDFKVMICLFDLYKREDYNEKVAIIRFLNEIMIKSPQKREVFFTKFCVILYCNEIFSATDMFFFFITTTNLTLYQIVCFFNLFLILLNKDKDQYAIMTSNFIEVLNLARYLNFGDNTYYKEQKNWEKCIDFQKGVQIAALYLMNKGTGNELINLVRTFPPF